MPTISAADSPQAVNEVHMPVNQWHIIERESGPINYYSVVNDPITPYIRAQYRPNYETAVLGYQLSDDDREHARKVRWSWRAVSLPQGGNECAAGKGDSAAVVYLTWKRGLRWYSLKYVWSSVGPQGAVCDRKRNPFVAQDTTILETGGPLNTWKKEEIDLYDAFRWHFEDGHADADVPKFFGVGIMTDGDQTQSASVADYADFVLVRQ
jgi:hypothetical protein